MNYLLDTCVISELVKPSPNRKAVNWLRELPSEALFLCVITIGELRKGLTKLQESHKKERLAVWLNTLVEEYKERILPIDLMVSENWGMIRSRFSVRENRPI
jgi:predicted nucleic acid-binding protein